MKIKRIILIMICTIIFIPNKALASENIIETTSEALDISSFISEAGKYTQEVFKDINFSEVLQDAMKGEIDTTSFGKKVLNLLGIEIKSQITMIGSIIIIIVIHSILKSISDGLENR